MNSGSNKIIRTDPIMPEYDVFHGTVTVADLVWPQTIAVTVHVPGTGLSPEF
jgi:hypothetical protein